MTGGKAHGIDREYQVGCRDILTVRNPGSTPWQGDGIDVPFDFSGTEWTIDVALRDPSGALIVAECRRTTGAVEQGDVLLFACKVEELRRSLEIPVAGIFMTKTAHQIGAVRVGDDKGIDLAVLDEGSAPPGFNITFLRYDVEREKQLRDIVMHVPSVSYSVTGFPVTLTHKKVSGDSESR